MTLLKVALHPNKILHYLKINLILQIPLLFSLMKMNFIIYLIKLGISICPERNLTRVSFVMHLRRYYHPPPPPHNHTQKCQKIPKVISVNLALEVIKETSFLNTMCPNPWKIYGVKKNVLKIWFKKKNLLVCLQCLQEVQRLN